MLWWTLRQLNSNDWGAANRAALQLGTSKETKAVEPLIEALRRPYEALRFSAAWALGEIGDPRAVPPLIAAFQGHPAEAYARVLAKFKDSRAIPPLFTFLLHEDRSIRDLVRKTLDEIDAEWPKSEAAKAEIPSLVTTIRDGTPDLKRVALELLELTGERSAAVDTLVALIHSDVNSVGWVVRVLDDLAPGWRTTERGKELVPALVAVIRGQGFERDLAAATLGDIGDPEAVPPLIASLRDRARALRNAAARALGRIGDPRAIAPIAAAPLDARLDPWVASQALNGIDPRWATTPEARAAILSFIEKLTDKDGFVREYAESTLTAIEPVWTRSTEARDAVPYFEQKCGYPDAEVREAAGRVLAMIRAAAR